MLDIKIFVDTDSDERFIRRLKRDIAERGREVQSVINQYLETVRPMHNQFVEPSKRCRHPLSPPPSPPPVASASAYASPALPDLCLRLQVCRCDHPHRAQLGGAGDGRRTAAADVPRRQPDEIAAAPSAALWGCTVNRPRAHALGSNHRKPGGATG